ncbi:Myc-type, basic helix-loop-helix domain-containing protein [Tanacetum coccineum]
MHREMSTLNLIYTFLQLIHRKEYLEKKKFILFNITTTATTSYPPPQQPHPPPQPPPQPPTRHHTRTRAHEPPPPPAAAATTGGSSKDRRQQQLKSTPVNHRNDDGLPEEEPNKFQVFRSACKLTGRMKATRLTTDVRQAVVWFVLNNSPEVDADILAYREKSPDNVETNFPAWFNHKIREKKVNDGCSEELFSLACGPISTCTYPACIVNGVKFVVHERDILHTTQCSGVSTPGLDGEMYYGQLEEILKLTYIGHRKVVLFRCKWFDTINPKNHTTRNRRSYIDQGIYHILTDREFHKNNQYILATQATQVFYLQDLARQPRGWKVVEHVYHRDVAESDQDVIHGSSSSHVTLSVGLTCLEHTYLSINARRTPL